MADCQLFNTDGIISIMRKDCVDYSTTDGITWHKMTKEELEQLELRRMKREEIKKKALEIKIPDEIRIQLSEIANTIGEDFVKYENILKSLERISKLFPYREFGINNLSEAMAYLNDTESTLKERIEEV